MIKPASDTADATKQTDSRTSRSAGIVLAVCSLVLAGGLGYVFFDALFPPVRVREFVVRQVAEYPHDPRAFTQGLVFDRGDLLESTGHYGESTVRRVELATGKVLKQIELSPDVFAEGITIWDGRVIQLTWKSREAYEYDLETFEQTGKWEYTGEGWGLTHDGTSLIVSDGSAIIRFLDPKTHEVQRSIRVTDRKRPVENLNELEYIDGLIFANIWYSDRIARIDPNTGEVEGWIDLTGLYPAKSRSDEDDVMNGIAWDPENRRLFVTGKNWPAVFEFTLEEVIPE